METVLGNLLRTGVLLSATVVALGGIIYLARHAAEVPDYRAFRGEPADLRSLRGIAEDVLAVRGRGIIQMGFLLLIATPLLRVAFSLVAFAIQRDRTYVAATLIVLGVLLYSLFGQ